MRAIHWPEVFSGLAAGMTVMGMLWAVSNRKSGTLRIDRSDPNKDRYLIELDDLENLAKKKRVVLVVDPNANLSQN